MVFINGEFIKIAVERAEARLHGKHDPMSITEALVPVSYSVPDLHHPNADSNSIGVSNI